MKIRILLRKIAFTLIGIFLSALGVSLSIKSTIGSSPMGVCAAVLSPSLRITNGMATGIQFILFFLVQVIILGKNFPPFPVITARGSSFIWFFSRLYIKFINCFTKCSNMASYYLLHIRYFITCFRYICRFEN